jgi:hypothetical protein
VSSGSRQVRAKQTNVVSGCDNGSFAPRIVKPDRAIFMGGADAMKKGFLGIEHE